MSKPIL